MAKTNPFDLVQSLRQRRMLNSLFEPKGMIGIPQDQPAPIIKQSPLNPPDTGLAGLRTRATPAIDEYKAYLGSEPNRRDYEQGKLGKILSSIAGFTEGVQKGPREGVNVAASLMDRPYAEAVSDYKSKGGRLKELSDLEYRGLTDQQKLEVQIAQDERDRTKEAHDWLKDQKGMQLTDKQMQNLDSQMKARGWSTELNKKTGDLEAVNTATGERKNFGQFMESPEQADLREFTQWGKKEGIQQRDRLALQHDAQAHAKFMEGLRVSGDKGILKFKQELADDAKLKNLDPTQSNAAYTGATSEILLEHPEWKEQLFTTDPTGNLIMKDKYPQDVYATFLDAVKIRGNRKKGLDTTPGVGTGFTGAPTVTAPPSDIPQVTMPGNETRNVAPPISMPQPDMARQQAIQELANIHIDHPTEEMIQEAMKDLAKQGGTR